MTQQYYQLRVLNKYTVISRIKTIMQIHSLLTALYINYTLMNNTTYAFVSSIQ